MFGDFKSFDERVEKNRKELLDQFRKLERLQLEMKTETKVLQFLFQDRERIYKEVV